MIQAQQNPTTAQLYHQYQHLVFRTCLRYCKNAETAHDLCQEVFARLHQNRVHEDRKDWAAWLYTISVNHTLDYLRTHNRRTRILEQWAHHFETEGSSGGETQEWARIEVETLLGTADELTRNIIMLHLSEGVPQGEVASLLKVSRMTVNTRIRKFRESLPLEYQKRSLDLTILLLISSIIIGGRNGFN